MQKPSGKNFASRLMYDYWQRLKTHPADLQPSEDPKTQALLDRSWVFDFYIKPFLDNFVKWYELSNERANFTYNLTEINLEQLAAFVSVVTGCGIAAAQAYLVELNSDAALRAHVNDMTARSDLRDLADMNQGYGRRLGWYAIVRATKPKIVVETGVDKGLGSCVLAAALIRNADEGSPGRYFGTDINPRAGYLFAPPYSQMGEILYGDSIASLSCFAEKIDLFINDSDHSAEYEMTEYRTIADKMSERPLILGDNAHASSSLFNFSRETRKKYLFFSERPAAHFYPGCGIGACF